MIKQQTPVKIFKTCNGIVLHILIFNSILQDQNGKFGNLLCEFVITLLDIYDTWSLKRITYDKYHIYIYIYIYIYIRCLTIHYFFKYITKPVTFYLFYSPCVLVWSLYYGEKYRFPGISRYWLFHSVRQLLSSLELPLQWGYTESIYSSTLWYYWFVEWSASQPTQNAIYILISINAMKYIVHDFLYRYSKNKLVAVSLRIGVNIHLLHWVPTTAARC